MAANVMRKGRCRLAFLKALPLSALLALSWSWGETAGYRSARSEAAELVAASSGPQPGGVSPNRPPSPAERARNADDPSFDRQIVDPAPEAVPAKLGRNAISVVIAW